MNSTPPGERIWDSLRHLSEVTLVQVAPFRSKADAHLDAVSPRQIKVRSWRNRVLLKKSLRLQTQLAGNVSEHSLAVLDEFGVVVAWYDRGRSTRGDDVLQHHVSQFYVTSDVANGMPARHLRAAHVDGSSIRRGWRLHYDGTAFWGTTRITPILLGDGRLQGFAHLTQILAGAPIDYSTAVTKRSPSITEFLSDILLPGERRWSAEPPMWNAYPEQRNQRNMRACACA